MTTPPNHARSEPGPSRSRSNRRASWPPSLKLDRWAALRAVEFMGYYVRAFCTNPKVPDLTSIQAWLRQRQSAAIIDDPNHAVEAAQAGESRPSVLDLATSDWEQVAIAYRAGKLPILAECNRDDGTDESLMREEIAEFVEFIGEPGRSAARQRVLEHLVATRFVISCQLPTSDIEDDGLDANGDFLSFFVEHCGGMIQADGEGFYDGDEVIVPLK